MNEWCLWFAWYPVRAFGHIHEMPSNKERWVWLRRVEWAEGHTDGDYIYRLTWNAS